MEEHMNKPWAKLLDRLTVMQDFKAEWPDYWRGFWDGTRAIRHDASPALGPATDKFEYSNGYIKGDHA